MTSKLCRSGYKLLYGLGGKGPHLLLQCNFQLENECSTKRVGHNFSRYPYCHGGLVKGVGVDRWIKLIFTSTRLQWVHNKVTLWRVLMFQ